ncbi:MAG TPA: tRNA (guanosine(37)-N1)-methyltransferase TrmD, partial [Clostridia bacterium]|nr:tRNA (guanosine(37)-N1)-methyltransferase TrmD [Clostridia bacterium]
MSLKVSILSLFPEQVIAALSHSITGRAIAGKQLTIESVQIRDFAVNAYGQVDDAPYGGGRGMVMMCEPIYQAWRSAVPNDRADVKTIYLSPAGKVFDQAMAHSLSKERHIALICGHYEGVDSRVIEEIRAEEVSIGNFILTGGELAAAVILDAVTRLIPGVLPDEEAWQLESFSDGLLEWPQYT